MKCNEFEIQLNVVLDDCHAPQRDAALVEHARNCASCAELLVATGELFEGVAGLSIPELDGTMPQRVLDELKRETITSAPRYGLIAAAMVATAAAVLVAAFLLPASPEGEGNLAAEQAVEPLEVEVAMAKPVDLDRDMLLKLFKDTRREIDEIPSLLTGGSSQPSAEETPPESQRDGLDEITESVVGSFGFLLDVLEETDRQPNS